MVFQARLEAVEPLNRGSGVLSKKFHGRFRAQAGFFAVGQQIENVSLFFVRLGAYLPLSTRATVPRKSDTGSIFRGEVHRTGKPFVDRAMDIVVGTNS